MNVVIKVLLLDLLLKEIPIVYNVLLAVFLLELVSVLLILVAIERVAVDQDVLLLPLLLRKELDEVIDHGVCLSAASPSDVQRNQVLFFISM